MSKIKSAWLFMIMCIMVVTYIDSKPALASEFLTESEGKQVYFLNEDSVASGPIFLEGDCPGGWTPGCSIKKAFYINNPTDEEFYIKEIKLDLSLMDIEGKQAYKNGDDVYEDFVRYVGARIENTPAGDLYSDNLKLLSDGITVDKIYIIDPGESRKFYFTMWMDEDAENSIQGLKCDFDIKFLCSSAEESEKYNRHKKKHETGERAAKLVSIKPPEKPSEDFTPDLSGDYISPQTGAPVPDGKSGMAGLLPETGSIADMDSVVAAGVLIAGIGSILVFKKHK